MSVVTVRAALETALAAMSPALSTAYEDVAFTPVAATPYQRAEFMFASPDTSEIGRAFGEQGFMQVTLCYPFGSGTAALNARVDLLRATFYRGATFTSGADRINITAPVAMLPGYRDADRWCVPCRIRFFAPIGA